MISKINRIRKILSWHGDWPLRCSLSTNEIMEIKQLLDELEQEWLKDDGENN